jgi:hypothetical protein
MPDQPSTPSTPAAAPSAPAPALADDRDNLVVYVFPDPNNPTSPVGGLYSLPPGTYANPDLRVTGDRAGTPMALLMQGVVVAKIPNVETGVGGFCYLLNLPALTPPDVNPGASTDPKKGT